MTEDEFAHALSDLLETAGSSISPLKVSAVLNMANLFTVLEPRLDELEQRIAMLEGKPTIN